MPRYNDMYLWGEAAVGGVAIEPLGSLSEKWIALTRETTIVRIISMSDRPRRSSFYAVSTSVGRR
jgi:hypothetical protein